MALNFEAIGLSLAQKSKRVGGWSDVFYISVFDTSVEHTTDAASGRASYEIAVDSFQIDNATAKCYYPVVGLLHPDTMAPITSDSDAMRSPSIKWPESPRTARPSAR